MTLVSKCGCTAVLVLMASFGCKEDPGSNAEPPHVTGRQAVECADKLQGDCIAEAHLSDQFCLQKAKQFCQSKLLAGCTASKFDYCTNVTGQGEAECRTVAETYCQDKVAKLYGRRTPKGRCTDTLQCADGEVCNEGRCSPEG